MTYKERVKRLNDLRMALNRLYDDFGRKTNAIISSVNDEIYGWDNSKGRESYEEYRLEIKEQAVFGYYSLKDLMDNLSARINEIKVLEENEYDKFKYLANINEYGDLAMKKSKIYNTDMDSAVRSKIILDLERNAAHCMR